MHASGSIVDQKTTLRSHDLSTNCSRMIPHHKRSTCTSYHIANYVSYDKFSVSHIAFMFATSSYIEPKCFLEAVMDPRWQLIMVKEIEALKTNNTWTIKDALVSKKPVDCKWVYKIKYDADEMIERYKAWFVAKSYT